MSLPRSASGLCASTTSALTKFAAAPRRCPQCFQSRAFSNSIPARQTHKRQLQTATAYHPSSLNPAIPPRNFSAQDTSISRDSSEISKAGPPPPVPQQKDFTAQKTTKFDVSEGEAQKSKPAGKPLRPRRYNFGPRKATIKISQSAVSHLRALLDQPEPKLIRIGTKAKGCSGLAYHLEYVDKPSPLDEQVEQDGVKVLIDNKALLNIIGSEMDWLDDKLNQRFVFKNPNITEQCGCGESFSVS